MGNNGYFFRGDSVLLPQGADGKTFGMEIPLSDIGDLPFSDRFTIPEIGGGGADGDTSSGGHAGEISCVVVPPEIPLPPRWQTIPVRRALAAGDSNSRLLRAFHIAQWRQESLFCGSCGARNGDDPAEKPARRCPACGRIEYPRISPAIIMLITNNKGEILLAHNKKFTPGVYSLIAGFVEAGETLEAAAIRETREEVNIEIRDLQYLVSQPWPFPNSLTMGFTARHATGTVKPDGIEIEDAQWFSRDNLPALPGPGSMSRHLIEQWKKGD